MSTVYVVVIAVLVAAGFFAFPANAAQLDAIIPKNSEEFTPTFQFTRIVSIQYDENSKLAELIGTKQQRITVDINSENTSLLVDMINSDLEQKSFAKVTNMMGEYSAIVIPQKNSVTIEYKLVLRPTLQGHFIDGSENSLDSQWRGLNVLEKIPIETKYGSYDINSPKSVFAATMPETLEYLSDSDAMKILDLRLVDASGISELSLSKWEAMFDPTAKMKETENYGFSGNVITNYSMGICTVYLGICQDRDFQESFVIESHEYQIRSIESQDDATIIIEGYAENSHLGKIEIFSVQDSAPSKGSENDTQVPALYAVSGVGVAIAAGFFVWSDRKTKKISTEQTGIDPKDLSAVPIGSSAGSYQTNRVTAELTNVT